MTVNIATVSIFKLIDPQIKSKIFVSHINLVSLKLKYLFSLYCLYSAVSRVKMNFDGMRGSFCLRDPGS